MRVPTCSQVARVGNGDCRTILHYITLQGMPRAVTLCAFPAARPSQESPPEWVPDLEPNELSPNHITCGKQWNSPIVSEDITQNPFFSASWDAFEKIPWRCDKMVACDSCSPGRLTKWYETYIFVQSIWCGTSQHIVKQCVALSWALQCHKPNQDVMLPTSLGAATTPLSGT